MSKRTDSNLFAYLEALNILEHGTDAEIKAAKRAYWKAYYTRYRRSKRQEQPEFSVSLSRKNGDYGKIAIAAKRHHLPVTAFIRCAALAYLDRVYLVPNTQQLARLEQLLQACLNEVQAITHTKEKYHWEREQKYDAIAARIDKLAGDIQQVLRYPSEVPHDTQD